MSTVVGAPPATKWSTEHQRLVTEALYGHIYNDLCSRLYGKFDLLLNVLQMAAGSAVLITAGVVFFGDEKGTLGPKASAATGAVLGVISIFATFWQPALRAERHRAASAAFVALHGRAWTMKTPVLASELAAARKDAPPGPRGLANPAANRTVMSLGHQAPPLSGWEKLLDLLA